jgi:hemerythrin
MRKIAMPVDQEQADHATPFMRWTREMSVAVTMLDDDHKKMIWIINELHEGIEAGHRQEVLVSVLGHLEEYARFHFAREEDLFARCSYLDAHEHEMEHMSFVKRIHDVRQRFLNTSVAQLDLELMNFLRNWMLTHIQGSDKKYGPRLNACGFF